MDQQTLRTIVHQHQSTVNAVRAVVGHLIGLHQSSELVERIRSNAPPDGELVRKQIQEILGRLPMALSLCERNGHSAWDELRRALQGAEELINQLASVVPARKR